MKKLNVLKIVAPTIIALTLGTISVAYAGFPPPAPNYVHAYITNQTATAQPIITSAGSGTVIEGKHNPNLINANSQTEIIDDGSTYYPAAFTTHIGNSGPGQCVVQISLLGADITQQANGSNGSNGFTCSLQSDHIVLKKA